MARIPLASSTIQSVDYDVNTMTMEIEFTNGNLYQYFDVPQHVYDGLLTAPSAGAYLNANVKGTYRFAKL